QCLRTIDFERGEFVEVSGTFGGDMAAWIPLSVAREDVSAAVVDMDVDDDDLAQVLYTSGTESRPKGVMLSHKSIISEYVSCVVDGKKIGRASCREIRWRDLHTC